MGGFGTHGLRVLQGLIEQQALGRVNVVGAMAWSKAQPRLGLNADADEKALQYCIESYQLNTFEPALFQSQTLAKALDELKPDVVLLATWGEILPKSVLNAHPSVAFINCHPALLPHHRGANPYTSAICEGEEQTGITFHVITPAIDAGDIILQQVVPIDPADTGGSLKGRCALVAQQSIAPLIHQLTEHGLTQAVAQDESGSYYPPITLTDGAIDWKNFSQRKVLNQIRGLQPWLDCYTTLQRPIFGWKPFIILQKAQVPSDDYLSQPEGTIISVSSQHLRIACAGQQAVDITQYQIHTTFGFLSVQKSMMIGPRLFKVGDTFIST
jgi:methionyl-tRNA formyltransferase